MYFPTEIMKSNPKNFKNHIKKKIREGLCTPWSSLRTASPGPPLLMNSSRTLLMTSSMTLM